MLISALEILILMFKELAGQQDRRNLGPDNATHHSISPSQGRPLLLTEGTRSPRSMRSLINLLLSDSDDSSLRRSSPVERCVNPYFSTSFSHCVPLPEPGPPAKGVTHQTESGACLDRIRHEAAASLTKRV